MLIGQAALADNEKMDNPIQKKETASTEIKVETPALLKCFSNRRAFCYGLVAVAALINGGLQGYTLYDNTFGKNKAQRNNRKTAITSEIAMSVIMGFIAHLAVKEISRC